MSAAPFATAFSGGGPAPSPKVGRARVTSSAQSSSDIFGTQGASSPSRGQGRKAFSSGMSPAAFEQRDRAPAEAPRVRIVAGKIVKDAAPLPVTGASAEAGASAATGLFWPSGERTHSRGAHAAPPAEDYGYGSAAAAPAAPSYAARAAPEPSHEAPSFYTGTAPVRATGISGSSNAFASGANQNCGNVLTDRPTSRVLSVPGGRSSIVLG